MKKLIVELINRYYQEIFDSWIDKLNTSFGKKLSESQKVTFVESSIGILCELIVTSDYKLADQYLIDIYTLFSKAEINLIEISQIFGSGRNTLLNTFQKEKSLTFDPLIILGFIDEVFEQLFARYSMIYQNAQIKQLEKDRDRLRTKLELSQKYLNNILHTSETAIIVIDSKEKFSSWNKGAEDIFGYTSDEAIGKPSSLLLPDADKYFQELNYIRETVKNSSEVLIVDTERCTKDGRIIPVQLSVARLPNQNGEYSGRTVIIKDVSVVKQLQQQIDQSEKLAVIGQLAAGIAHEIGNPLASISSLVQLIQRKNKDESLGEQLVLIKENIDRISKIVRELVDFSRPPSYEKITIQITDIVKTAVGIVKYDKRVKKVNFETQFDPNIPLVKVVPDQVLQVFVNILINALDAIEGTGNIFVKTYHDDKNIFVSVTDNGCGMDADTISKIFDPFFTTKDVGKGTGLGLSVSYSIIKKLNGEILVESEISKGSTFTIRIPREEN
jgi:PAS domain S-box-containing protein